MTVEPKKWLEFEEMIATKISNELKKQPKDKNKVRKVKIAPRITLMIV